jgi:putative SOS response-associated peptidase YedK
VIADAFIEGTTKEGLEKAHLVYLQNKERPFAFAGIYDTWLNPDTGEELNSYSIITTVANDLLLKIPHHRSPIILPKGLENRWINGSVSLRDVTKMLRPYPAELMNAYPISNEIKSPSAEGKHLIDPIGNRLQAELQVKKSQEVKLTGMGTRKQYNEQNWDRKT